MKISILRKTLAALPLCLVPVLHADSLWDGLVSYYSFNDGSGLTLTDSIGGANGTLVNFSGSPWTSGLVGGALTFNGSDYVQVLNSSAPLGNSTRTVAGWVYFNSTADSQSLLTYGQRNFRELVAMTAYGGANYFFASHGDDINTGVPITSGQWNYYAMTFDGGTVTLYLNGSPIGSKSIPLNTTQNTTSGLLFGTHVQVSGDGNYFNYLSGSLDEWGIWNRALSQTEIGTLYNTGSGLTVPEPCTLLQLASFGMLASFWRIRRKGRVQ